jgi:hypothetical protein
VTDEEEERTRRLGHFDERDAVGRASARDDEVAGNRHLAEVAAVDGPHRRERLREEAPDSADRPPPEDLGPNGGRPGVWTFEWQ